MCSCIPQIRRSPSNNHPLAKVFEGVAVLWDGEPDGRGKEAAAALRAAIPKLPVTKPREPDFDEHVREVLREENSELSMVILEVYKHINWAFSGASLPMPKGVGDACLTAELLGPDGMVKHQTIRVGLFFQEKNLIYPIRKHEAEEAYCMIAGTAEWYYEGTKNVWKKRGEYRHHLSMMGHASFTKERSFIATWRWCGNITADSYECEDPEDIDNLEEIKKHSQPTT